MHLYDSAELVGYGVCYWVDPVVKDGSSLDLDSVRRRQHFRLSARDLIDHQVDRDELESPCAKQGDECHFEARTVLVLCLNGL